MKTNMISALALIAFAGVASAQPNVVIFTDELDDSINLLTGSGAIQELVDLSGGTNRLAGITRGPNGEYYFADGPLPPNMPVDAGIIKVENLFSPVPSVSYLSQGGNHTNPIGIHYHSASDSVLAIENPGSAFSGFEGLLSVDRATGNQTISFTEPSFGNPRPRYNAGVRVTQVAGSDDVWVISENGGVGGPAGPDNEASMLFRFAINPGTKAATTVKAFDLSGSVTGLGFDLMNVRGVATDPATGDVFVTEQSTDAIYRITFDGAGDIDTITAILTQTEGGGALENPGEIIYNPFTNMLVFGEAAGRISAVNLDGSGVDVLATGVNIRGLYAVPAPGAGALLALAGLAAVRRRR